MTERSTNAGAPGPTAHEDQPSMPQGSQEQRFGRRMEELEELLLNAERAMPAPTLELTRSIVSAVLDVHRAALVTLLEALDAKG